MHLLAKVPFTCLELVWNKEVAGPALVRAQQLRGALAQAFADDDVFHQHDAQGKLLYRYPHVQYRWLDGHGIVAGWEEEAGKLLQIPWLDLPLRLGDEEVFVTDVMLQSNHSLFGIGERLLRYRLVSPVLLFNQQNYQRYQGMSALEQQDEQDRLLIAQVLIAMRGLQVNFDSQLYAAFTRTSPQVCRYKQQKLLGLKGEFVCNAVLPTGFAVGHAVSHGFGWIACRENLGEDEL